MLVSNGLNHKGWDQDLGLSWTDSTCDDWKIGYGQSCYKVPSGSILILEDPNPFQNNVAESSLYSENDQICSGFWQKTDFEQMNTGR